MKKYGQQFLFARLGWRKVVSNYLKKKGELSELDEKSLLKKRIETRNVELFYRCNAER